MKLSTYLKKIKFHKNNYIPENALTGIVLNITLFNKFFENKF